MKKEDRVDWLVMFLIVGEIVGILIICHAI